MEQDFPSTGDLNIEVKRWALEFLKNEAPDPIDAYAARTSANYYDLLWKNREDYCAGLTAEQRAVVESRTKPNYERVLGDLNALMNGVLSKPYGDPVLKWIPHADVFGKLGIVPDTPGLDEHGSSKIFYAVQGQLETLLDRLADRIRNCSRRFEAELTIGRATEKFEPYQRLLTGLNAEFEVGIYNLNYDTVALNAVPRAFVGFERETGRFLPDQVLGRTKWGFLYHLHGSVHHRMQNRERVMENQDFGPKIVWHEDLLQTGESEDWEDTAHITEGSDKKRLLLTTLIAGGWKLDQLQEEPFLTLYSCLPRHVHEADAILICGYGFGDSHINSILKHALRSRATGAGRPPVMILGYNARKLPTAKRGGAWTTAMGQALRVSPQRFRDRFTRAEAQWTELPDHHTPGEFEYSPDAPVAIWNDGFLAAAGKTEPIIEWLAGERPG